MQVRKTYQEINPELLYAEIRDFILKQGGGTSEAKLETYTMPDESATFISRSTIILRANDPADKTEKEFFRAHIVGSMRGETKLMLDIDEKLFPQEKTAAFQEDLDFIFSSYESEG